MKRFHMRNLEELQLKAGKYAQDTAWSPHFHFCRWFEPQRTAMQKQRGKIAIFRSNRLSPPRTLHLKKGFFFCLCTDSPRLTLIGAGISVAKWWGHATSSLSDINSWQLPLPSLSKNYRLLSKDFVSSCQLPTTKVGGEVSRKLQVPAVSQAGQQAGNWHVWTILGQRPATVGWGKLT